MGMDMQFTRILWDAIIFLCPRYLLLSLKSSNIKEQYYRQHDETITNTDQQSTLSAKYMQAAPKVICYDSEINSTWLNAGLYNIVINLLVLWDESEIYNGVRIF